MKNTDQDLEFVDLEEEEIEEFQEVEEEFEDVPSKKSGVKAVQAIVGIIMLLLVVAAFIMVVRWQKGKKLVINPEDLTEDYSIETMDYVEFFNPTLIQGYEYDGSYDILILGDKMVYGEAEDTGLAAKIRENTKGNVTCLATPTATISTKNENYSLDYPEDAFSLYYIALCMTACEGGDYSLQDAALEHIEEDREAYKKYVEGLREVDMKSIDVLIISCGFYDYLDAHRLENGVPTEEHMLGDKNGVNGALYDSLTMLKNAYPTMQIVVSSPTFCFVENKDGERIGADLYKSNGCSLGDYVGSYGSVVASMNVSFVDNYFGAGFTCDNYEGYLTEDGTKLTEKGAKAVADHVCSFLYQP